MIYSFWDKFTNVDDKVGEMLDEIQKSNIPVVFWGAGCCITMFLELFQESNIKVSAIIDSNPNKIGTTIQNIPIKNWEQVNNSLSNFSIVISTSHFDEIINQLKELKFKGSIYYLPKNAYYKNTVYSLAFIKKFENRFRNVYEQLKDDISKKVYLNVLKNNMSLDNRYFEEISSYEIRGYFGTDLFMNIEDEIIVDGGAFTGDTIQEFFEHPDRKYKKIYAFEPDEENYKLLKENCFDIENIILICSGLGEKKETLKFCTGVGVSSHIDIDGNASIEIDSLDEVFDKQAAPTFIKMDIEGSERNALIGAKNIIKKYLPTLAISAYHKMEDMFTLVELIQEISGNRYDIFMRHTFYYQKIKIQPDVIIYAKRRSDIDII